MPAHKIETYRDATLAFIATIGLILAVQPLISALDGYRVTRGVNHDIDDAYSAGVRTTPTMFINGRMMQGNR